MMQVKSYPEASEELGQTLEAGIAGKDFAEHMREAFSRCRTKTTTMLLRHFSKRSPQSAGGYRKFIHLRFVCTEAS